MASCYENVALYRYNKVKKTFDLLIEEVDLRIEVSSPDLILFISNKTGGVIEIKLNIRQMFYCRLSSNEILIDTEKKVIGNCELNSFSLNFQNDIDANELFKKIDNLKLQMQNDNLKLASIFDSRTDDWSASQYFQFYSYLSQQQNMMQDYVRTSTYQRAVLSNCADFRNKVVLDVGAGSGILSFFAAQAGAKRVYAVEASNMAKYCDQLIQNNKLAGRIIVVSGKIEEVNIPEPIDILISEPMGYMLFNERMLETYVHAKKFFRKDAPKMMFPTVANLYIAPFSDESIYMEQSSKANFWYQSSFHGVDLSSVREAANKENFGQPIVDTFDVGICMAPPVAHKVDFREIEEKDLYVIDIDLNFTMQQTGCCHGLAIWFDVGFLGSQKPVWLSTGPTEPLTHWYQVRCCFMTPIFVYEGQSVTGKMLMNANSRQSYDVDIELSLPGTTCKVSNKLDLKNPYFRYTGQPMQPPPGTQTKSPTENYFNQYNSKNQMSWSNDSMITNENVSANNNSNQLLMNNSSISPFSPQSKNEYE